MLRLTGETWLDLAVNAVPIGILLVMDALFLVVNPWGWDPWYVFWAHFLTLFPLVALALLSYVSGFVVQRDEGRDSESAGAEP